MVTCSWKILGDSNVVTHEASETAQAAFPTEPCQKAFVIKGGFTHPTLDFLNDQRMAVELNLTVHVHPTDFPVPFSIQVFTGTWQILPHFYSNSKC